MNEDCYIYWDEEYIYIQCTECHAKNEKGVIWHAAMGYKNNIICSCGKVIHQEDNMAKDK